jgi:prepilin-type N-terminal cleavage/methylation domain-containing protein
MASFRGPQLPAARFCLASERGFSLPELMLTIGIIAVISAIAVVQFGTAQQSIKGDGTMRVVLTQINTARELAISQRRNMEIRAAGLNGLQIVRQDVPSGTTIIGTVLFESNAQYVLPGGVPDTPDGFGRTKAFDFGSATSVLFSSDGTCIDQTGNPVNGTIFVGIPGQPLSARAITVLGGTGRVRAYRWNGARWVAV